jgi:sigma-B regulation protein RsbU (phosphoserine phosphatase)
MKPDDNPSEDFEDLFDHAPCGYLCLDPDGQIINANQTLSTMLGIPIGQLKGKRFEDLLTVPGRIFYETHFAPLLRMQGYFNEVALDFVTAQSKILHVLANASERVGGANEPRLTRVTLFPATMRRRYERELMTARTAERETAELREQFIAVLGHDLRNPLAAITGALRMLAKQVHTDTAARCLGLMQGSVTRMSRLIDDVLDFARGRLGGGIVLARSAHEDLKSILQHVVDELQAIYPNRLIEAEVALAAPVNCDGSRIGQLASNLLANALTHGAAHEAVRIGASEHDGLLEIWVSNGGDPIPPAAMARLFQPFVRGKVRANQQGLGLGLHIASEIARAHDGTINVSSTVQETRFTFVMPLID